MQLGCSPEDGECQGCSNPGPSGLTEVVVSISQQLLLSVGPGPGVVGECVSLQRQNSPGAVAAKRKLIKLRNYVYTHIVEKLVCPLEQH